MTAELRCERAGAQHTSALLELFAGTGSGCFCNYWHFEGDKNAWLEQCYIHPDKNREALSTRLAAPELSGVVARRASAGSDGAVSGWLKVTPATAVKRLYDQRVYRNLPTLQGNREGVYTIGCCYVAAAERGSGVLKALLEAAPAIVKAAGGSVIEAFPRKLPEVSADASESERLRPDEIWLGPEALFLEHGFVAVSDFKPYPVLRLHLP